MTRPLAIGLAGLGTVGAGLLRQLRENAETVTARAGRPLAVAAVSARDRARELQAKNEQRRKLMSRNRKARYDERRAVAASGSSISQRERRGE